MPFKLKETAEAFQVVDGPYAGKDFKPGIIYNDIPPQEANRFEKAKDEPASKGDKKGGK
ncbi:MAG: hypothetical protein ABSC54_00855 [Smithellaceae bacterium]|jgi:hypothetical protein